MEQCSTLLLFAETPCISSVSPDVLKIKEGEDPGSRIECFPILNTRGVSNTKSSHIIVRQANLQRY